MSTYCLVLHTIVWPPNTYPGCGHFLDQGNFHIGHQLVVYNDARVEVHRLLPERGQVEYGVVPLVLAGQRVGIRVGLKEKAVLILVMLKHECNINIL